MRKQGSNLRPPGHEPGELPLLYSAIVEQKKSQGSIHLELITSALGSTLITISFLHFLQYAGKLHIFVFGNTFKKCGLPHFGHLHHLELIYYQLSPFGWLKCLTRCIIKQTYVCFNIFLLQNPFF